MVRHWPPNTQTHTQTHTDTQTQTHTDTDTQTDRQTHTHTDTHTHIHRRIPKGENTALDDLLSVSEYRVTSRMVVFIICMKPDVGVC